MAFGSEIIHSATLMIDVDPAAADKFHLMRAPRDLTVIGARVVGNTTGGAGTAIAAQVEVWDKGTAVSGTVVAQMGGTATADLLTADTPKEGTVSSTYKNVDSGDWLVIGYLEEGSGWVAGNRLLVQVDYVLGKA